MSDMLEELFAERDEMERWLYANRHRSIVKTKHAFIAAYEKTQILIEEVLNV